MKTPDANTKLAGHSQGAGTVLLRDGALLPPVLAIELESFVPGWSIVKNCDGYVLGRMIMEANWKFARFGREYRASVIGREQNGILGRGVTQILSELGGRKFDALEITSVILRRFLGMAYLNLSVSLWHLSDDMKARAA